jgi:hypothetical protein
MHLWGTQGEFDSENGVLKAPGRSPIRVVSQNPRVWSTTGRERITMGMPDGFVPAVE